MAEFTEKLGSNERDSGSTSRLATYYERLGNWADQAYEEAAGIQQEVPEIKQISEALDYLVGLQWKQDMPSYRAKPVSNEILSMFWETIGLLTDIKPMFNIKDIGGQGSYSKIEDILNALAKGWASNSKFERKLAFCTMFGMLTSAPAKIYWNPFANGHSGDPSDGDITLEALPASSLLRLGEGDDLQEDECIIYRKTRTLAWIKRAYPRMGPLVQPEEAKSKYTVEMQAPLNVMPQLFQNLSPGMKRMMGANERTNLQSVYPRAEVREYWMRDDMINESSRTIWMGPQGASWGYWVKPGQKLYPRGRLVVRANSVTLWDEPNPYYHRKKPFAMLGLYAVPWQQYAMSVIGPWMKQQDILNQIMSGLLQCVKKAVNPPLMAPKQAIHPEALRAIDSSKPNLKISFNANAASAPTWGTPPSIPAYVLPVYGIIQKSMKQGSGAAAMDEASGKKQVPGGDTLDRITFSKNTPVRMMGRNVEDFVDEIGTIWAGTALQFYDAGKRMELLGEQGLAKEDIDNSPGTLIPDGIDSEAFVRRWRFKSDKGTLLNVQRQDRVQIGFALRRNHDLSRKRLYSLLDWNIDLEKNDKELLDEAQAMAGAVGQTGAKPKGHK